MEASDLIAKLCEICSQLDPQHSAYPFHPCHNPLTCSEPPIEHRNVGRYVGYLSLGSIDAIKSRRSACDICKLVAERLDEEPSDLTGECRITETEKYCSFTLPDNIETRDPRVTHFHLTQTAVIFDTDEQFQGPPLPWETKTRYKRSGHYLLQLQTKARLLPGPGDQTFASPKSDQEFLETIGGRYVGSQVNTQLIREWLHECEHEHGKDCALSMALLVGRREEPALVIDVDQSCVVDTPSQSRYVAVSYVWGRAAVYRHLLENTQDLRKPGFLRSPLIPATIRDAITLVRAIGERYLWVDSLCIVQDDLKMQQTEIMRMGSIYSNALFTIVAAAGDHANVGLPGIERGSRKQVQRVLKFPNCELLTVIDVRLSPSGIDDTIWAQRGWTFQERTLSTRVLVFSENQVYWSCRVVSHSEERALEKITDVNRLHKSFPQYGQAADSLSWKALRPFEYCTFYDALLYTYRQRQLTYQSDILSAFNGVTEVLGAIQSDRFFWGLPGSLFSYALTWELAGRSSRNYVEVPILASNGPKEIVPIPSWSWAAWQGKSDPVIHLSDLIDGEYMHPLIQFSIVDTNRQLVKIEEGAYPGPAYPDVDLRAVLQGGQSHQLEPLSPQSQSPLQIGQLHFWTSHATVEVARSWGVGVREILYDFLPPPDFPPNPYESKDGFDVVHQDFVVIAGRGTKELVLLAVEWRDGVAYRVGKAEVKAALWAQVENRQWRLVTLG